MPQMAQVWPTDPARAGLLEMSAGQHDDLTFSPQQTVGLEECRLMLERKSGAECGLFARLGAMAVSDEPAVWDAFASYGRCVGTANQILSDVYDIWHAPLSRDLLDGKQTLPVVHALHALKGAEREKLRAVLAASRWGAEAHGVARELLLRAGSLRYAALINEAYRQRALGQLKLIDQHPAAAEALAAIADHARLA